MQSLGFMEGMIAVSVSSSGNRADLSCPPLARIRPVRAVHVPMQGSALPVDLHADVSPGKSTIRARSGPRSVTDSAVDPGQAVIVRSSVLWFAKVERIR